MPFDRLRAGPVGCALRRCSGQAQGGPVPQLSMLFLEMTPDEKRVWRILQDHRGRARAITGAELAAQAEIPWRECRDLMKTLIEFHHCRIGSAPGRPPGYFIIETAAEAEECYRVLRGQGLSTLKRAAVLRGIELRKLVGQLSLEV